MIDLQEHLERYCNALPVFGFNSAKVISIYSKLPYYTILLTKKIMSLLSARKLISSSTLVIFSYLIFWTFLAEQQVLIYSWKSTKLQKQKNSSATIGLITFTNIRTQNFPLMTHSAVNFAAVTLLMPNPRTMLIFWKRDWPQKIRYQIETIKATAYWDWESSAPATNMGSGTNELIQWLFGLVVQ